MKRIVLSVLVLLICVIFVPLNVSSANLYAVSDVAYSRQTLIAEGVLHTYMELDGEKYGTQKINMVEFDLKQRNLYVEVMTAGKRIADTRSVLSMVSTYNNVNRSKGKTMVAAVNGALWMTSVNSTSSVTTQVLSVPRGVIISGGEILCSNEMPQEAAPGGWPALFAGFGITDDFVPVIGLPMVNLTLTNTTKNLTANADGLNRLPANNALVIYNSNCSVMNYAMADAYEIVLENVSGDFRHGAKVTGTVSEIADVGGKIALKNGKIVLTARGDKQALIEAYDIGDIVEIDVELYEMYGKSEEWQHVTEAMAGHIAIVENGIDTCIDDTTRYPCTIAGIKNDGSLILFQCDGRQGTQWSEGLRFCDMGKLFEELDVNTAINLDGGGSSTMVCGLELVNRPSDGASRSVVNAIGVAIGPQRCEQGSFTVNTPYRFEPTDMEFSSEDTLKTIGGENDSEAAIENGALKLTAKQSNDPYVYFNYAAARNRVYADDYKYIIIKMKAPQTLKVPLFELFLCAGDISVPTGGYSVTFDYTNDDEYHTYIIDLSEKEWWTGRIYGIRFDYTCGTVSAGECVYIESVKLAKTAENANLIQSGLMNSEETAKPYIVPTGPSVQPTIGYTTVQSVTTTKMTLQETTVTVTTTAGKSDEKTGIPKSALIPPAVIIIIALVVLIFKKKR